MIIVLTGDNSFELRQRLLSIKKDADGDFETVDGDSVTAVDLPSLLFGVSLFGDSRNIILKQLSANPEAWAKLADYIEKIDEQTNVVLVEPKLDKRTKTYKELKKRATIETFEPWTYKNSTTAIDWVVQTADMLGVKATKDEAKYLLDRVGFDQWRLYNSIEKLALIGSMSKKMTEAIVESDIHENVFDLLETALHGNSSEVIAMLHNLEKTEEPYRVFGLMSSQVFQLVAVSSSGSETAVVKDLKLHPYAVKKQLQLAQGLDQTKLRQVVELFAESDQAIRFARPDSVWAELASLLISVCKI